ncbi:hypothetical protein BJF82_15380 [Kytococcus sp. CUA-901]|nr:hypothetical protein BJF82_15380 [Kytococcus sp. CUA-901]
MSRLGSTWYPALIQSPHSFSMVRQAPRLRFTFWGDVVRLACAREEAMGDEVSCLIGREAEGAGDPGDGGVDVVTGGSAEVLGEGRCGPRRPSFGVAVEVCSI